MTFDLNHAEPPLTGGPIPDGTFAKVTMIIRAGGVDGESEIDRGLLKRSTAPGSDVLMLDCEFTVTEGPHARRKFWQSFVASGGKLDETGLSIGAKITKSALRAIIDSAHGLDPADMSDPAKVKRILRGFADLSGIGFVAKIKIEPSNNPAYGEKNKLEYAVAPTEPEWRKVMNGESVSARPSRRQFPSPDIRAGFAWDAPKAASAAPKAPDWSQKADLPVPDAPKAATPGPAWLNG